MRTVNNTKTKTTKSEMITNFSPLINDLEGGIQVYVHNDIIYQLCEYLVWNKPLLNKHVDSSSHKEWDGWATRGWSLCNMSAKQNLEINNCHEDELAPIEFNGCVVALAIRDADTSYYTGLINDFFSVKINPHTNIH